MDDFHYRGNTLCCEEVPVARIADAFGTPAYIYSQQAFLDHFDGLRTAFAELKPLICYAIKSCHNLSILGILARRGSGFDVVSGGELSRALEIGADPESIVFAGVGKTDDEIRFALERGIGCFNVESEQELARLNQIAADLNRRTTAALRINPDVDPKTHEYVTTGKRESKFGIDADRAEHVFVKFARSRHVELSGIHLHIGSLVNRVEAYAEAIRKAVALIETLRKSGFPIKSLNIGGGFGAHYDGSDAPSALDYAHAILPILQDKNLTFILEPGRSISANAGILMTRVIYTKSSGRRRFLVVDAAMTELIRPALYGAHHFVWPVTPLPGLVPPHRGTSLKLDGTVLVDVVGPVCECGDFLAKDRWLPPVEPGDLMAVFGAGAYAAVMASRYNCRPLAPEILVHESDYRIIRRRETYDDMVAHERL